jgi:hypothetical protein
VAFILRDAAKTPLLRMRSPLSPLPACGERS